MTVLDKAAMVSCQEMTPTPPANGGGAGNTSAPRLYRLGDLLRDFEEDAKAAHEAFEEGRARGPVSSFAGIDRAIGGAFMPGLHIVHGGPGTGKTAWALQVAACCGTPALFVSCEIGPLEIIRRMAARVTGTYLGRFKTGEMAPAEALELARRACTSSPLLAIVDGTAGFPGPDWLYQRAAEVKGESRHILLIVDSLHTWAARAGWNKPEYETLNMGLAALEQLAGALKAPLLVISERNRGSMERGGLNAAKGSSRIEYAGETVIGLDRDKDDGQGLSGETRIAARIEKNRHGMPGLSLPFAVSWRQATVHGGGVTMPGGGFGESC